VSERSEVAGEKAGPCRHENHPKPRTRREFLAQGLIAGAGFVVGPSLLALLAAPRRARAQMLQCNLSAGAGRIPFLCFDLAGGANVAGSNVVVGGPGGALEPLSAEGYEKLGLPATMLPQLPGQTNLELGLPFHADSAFLRGILSKTSPATRANVNGTVICARSENDTGNNPHNPTYGIARAGAAGELAVLVGTQNSVSGGNSQAPMSMIDASLRPTKVDRPSDATGLVDTGKLVSLLDQADAASVMRAVEQLAEEKLVRMNESQAVEDLMRCGYAETTYLVSTFGDPTVLDPRLDPDIVGAVGSIFTTDELGRSSFQKTASVMKLVVNGFAGAGTLEFGGYDYHDSTRSTGERQDFTAGQAMGAALEYAARRGRELMLYVFSDGSVNSTGQIDDSVDGRGKGIWKADDSQTAAAFILVYDPAGRPQLSRPGAGQIGWFRANGDLETGATRVSNNVDRLAEAIVLNYLALHGEVGRLAQVLPGHGLGSAAEIDGLVAFAPIR
jgi:hypothetical protein